MKTDHKSKFSDKFAEISEADFNAYVGPRAKKLAPIRTKALEGKMSVSGKLGLLGFLFPPALLFWPWLYRWWAGFWGVLALLIAMIIADVLVEMYRGEGLHMTAFAGLAIGMQLPNMYLLAVIKRVKNVRQNGGHPAHHGQVGRGAADWMLLSVAILFNLFMVASVITLLLSISNGEQY